MTDEYLISFDRRMVAEVPTADFSSLEMSDWSDVLRELDQRGKVTLVSGSYGRYWQRFNTQEPMTQAPKVRKWPRIKMLRPSQGAQTSNQASLASLPIFRRGRISSESSIAPTQPSRARSKNSEKCLLILEALFGTSVRCYVLM
jgi:hypothetical protein